MKKISIKASIAAVSLSLALTPLGFAQSPTVTQAPTQAAVDTQPLPGAKVAGLLTATGELTSIGLVLAAVIGVALVVAAASASNNGDDLAALQAFLNAQKTTGATSTR